MEKRMNIWEMALAKLRLAEANEDPKKVQLMKSYADKFGYEFDRHSEGMLVVGATSDDHAALYLSPDGELMLYHWNPSTRKKDASYSNAPIAPEDLERVIRSGIDPAAED